MRRTAPWADDRIDENVVAAQRRQLANRRIHFKRIGSELGRAGMKDDELVPLLRRIGNVTFFTCDEDFFDPRLRHAKCCFVWLDVEERQTAAYIRRFLKHPRFRTRKLRLGTVVRVAHKGLSAWLPKKANVANIPWTTRR
jgi:hypothetical protein